MEGNYKKWLNRINAKQDRLQDITGYIGVGKTDASATEKLDVNGNVKAIDFKGKSLKFDLQPTITPTPNTLVPKTDGSGLLWYDNNSVLRNIGDNLFSADLSSSTARNHSLNASFTIDTKGNAYSLKNLPNKNTDIVNFRKVRVQNASGLDSVVDSKNLLTDGVTSMTDAEKDAWRLAQRKTGETYSLGSPVVYSISPPAQKKVNNTIKSFLLRGNSLYLNPNFTRIAAIPVGVPDDSASHAGEILCKSFYSPQSGDFIRVDFDSNDLQINVNYNIIIWVDSPFVYKHRTANTIKLVSDVTHIDLSNISWQTFNNPLLSPYTNYYDFSLNAGNLQLSEVNQDNYTLTQDGNRLFTAISSNIPNITWVDNFYFRASGINSSGDNGSDSAIRGVLFGLFDDSITKSIGSMPNAFVRVSKRNTTTPYVAMGDSASNRIDNVSSFVVEIVKDSINLTVFLIANSTIRSYTVPINSTAGIRLIMCLNTTRFKNLYGFANVIFNIQEFFKF